MVLKLKENTPNLWQGAKCVNFPPTETEDAWFDNDCSDDAISLCNGTYDNIICPLRSQCLKFALANRERFGVWGGMSELGRAAMLRKLPPVHRKPNPEWKWMTEEAALDGFTDKEVSSMKAELQYDE